jgi:predicted component of type VI protein secretion system
VGADVNLTGQEPAHTCHISPVHCAVHLIAGRLALEDLGAANGTFLNRVRIKPGERPALKADDMIRLGGVTLKVRG